jgi:hypothetical protein
MRFDIVDADSTSQWKVTVNHGDLRVTRGDGDAQCVLRAEHRLFDGIVTGQANAMVALLRGEIAVTGDLELLVLLQQRIFPGPARPPARPGQQPSGRPGQPAATGGR